MGRKSLVCVIRWTIGETVAHPSAADVALALVIYQTEIQIVLVGIRTLARHMVPREDLLHGDAYSLKPC